MKIVIIGDQNNFKKSKLCNTLKYLPHNFEITDRYDNTCKIGIKWFCNENVTHVPKHVSTKIKVINEGFQSQDRFYLEKYHIQAFGYGLNVDPLKYQGKIFRKGKSHKYKFLKLPNNLVEDYHNKNGEPFYNRESQGIRYMTFLGPIDKCDEHSVYQKCIDRNLDKNIYQDYRITVINRKAVVILDTVHDDFIAHAVAQKKIILRKPEDFLKKTDLDKLNKFIELVGLDYGDLDLIIDKADSRLYVCDINNGPMLGGASNVDTWYKIPKGGKVMWGVYLQEIKKLLNIS